MNCRPNVVLAGAPKVIITNKLQRVMNAAAPRSDWYQEV